MNPRSLFLFAWLGLACDGAAAQPSVSPDAAAIALPSSPSIDPANELKGRKLLDALRKGGFVLYMRHAQSGAATLPCTGNVLTPAGEAQARKVAVALRELKIPIGAVLASQTCRAQDTARLLVGADAEVTEDLDPADLPRGYDVSVSRGKRLAEMPRAGTNTLLVSHVHAGRQQEYWMQLGLCEVIAYRPDGKGGTEAVARIPVTAWEGLIKDAGLD